MKTQTQQQAPLALETVETSELVGVSGGVMPVWTEGGEIVTCTDPRRWNGTVLYPTPFRF